MGGATLSRRQIFMFMQTTEHINTKEIRFQETIYI